MSIKKRKIRTANGHGVCLKGSRIDKSNSFGLDRFCHELKLGKVALAEMQVGRRKHIDGQQSKHLNSTAKVERRHVFLSFTFILITQRKESVFDN